jgi:hypothetical protein
MGRRRSRRFLRGGIRIAAAVGLIGFVALIDRPIAGAAGFSLVVGYLAVRFSERSEDHLDNDASARSTHRRVQTCQFGLAPSLDSAVSEVVSALAALGARVTRSEQHDGQRYITATTPSGAFSSAERVRVWVSALGGSGSEVIVESRPGAPALIANRGRSDRMGGRLRTALKPT